MTSMKSSANEQGSREQLREREKPWCENEMERVVVVVVGGGEKPMSERCW